MPCISASLSVLHICDKRERHSSHVWTVCGFQVCALLLYCLSTCLCVPLIPQTMWFVWAEVSQCLCIRCRCTSRLSGNVTFPPVATLCFYCSSLPFTYTNNQGDEGMQGVSEDGTDLSRSLHSGACGGSFPRLGSSIHSEGRTSKLLPFLSVFPLRFTVVSWSTPSLQASTGY